MKTNYCGSRLPFGLTVGVALAIALGVSSGWPVGIGAGIAGALALGISRQARG